MTNNATTTKRLHLGCGDHILAGWENVDGKVAPGVDRVFNANDGLWQLEDESYEWVYSSHFIEHLFPSRLLPVLQKLHRCLIPGGKLTLATTDFEGIYLHRFLERDNGEFWEAALFGACDVNDHPMDAHRNCFSFEKLADLLAVAGFTRMRPWTTAQYPEIDALEDYAKTCAMVSVLIEAVK